MKEVERNERKTFPHNVPSNLEGFKEKLTKCLTFLSVLSNSETQNTILLQFYCTFISHLLSPFLFIFFAKTWELDISLDLVGTLVSSGVTH